MNADKRRWFSMIAGLVFAFATNSPEMQAADVEYKSLYQNFMHEPKPARSINLFKQSISWSFPLSYEWEQEWENKLKAPRWPVIAAPEPLWPLLAN